MADHASNGDGVVVGACAPEIRATDPPLRILILEDRPADAELEKRTLSRAGLSFCGIVVDTRDSFIEQLETFKPHVILSDYALPAFTGEEALTISRQRCPEVPFIVVSGKLDEEQAVDFVQRGAWDYVSKDRLARLVVAVRRSLDLASQSLERRLVEEARRQAERVLAAHNRVLESIAIGEPLPLTLQLLVDELESQILLSLGAVIVAPETRGGPQHVVGPNLPPDFVRPLRDIRAKVPHRPRIVPSPDHGLVGARDSSADNRWSTLVDVAAQPKLAVCWSVEIPAFDRRRALGELLVFHPGPWTPTGNELQALSAIRHLASIAIERDRAQSRATHRGLHDPLTGLPNRALLLDRLTHALRSAKRRPTHLALLMIDLDGFKLVNDGFGHPVGDQLLIAVAKRLHKAARSSDTVARYGGDEFVFLSDNASDEVQAGAIASRLLQAIANPFEVGGERLSVTASIGIVTNCPDDTPELMLCDADAAMYRAKKQGGGQAEFVDKSVRGTGRSVPGEPARRRHSPGKHSSRQRKTWTSSP